jgi:hypothetical protein
MWHIISESPGHVLSLEKNPACLRLAQLRKLHLKLKNFFQPAGFFTEMLRFDKKNQRNFSEISLQLLKLLSIGFVKQEHEKSSWKWNIKDSIF